MDKYSSSYVFKYMSKLWKYVQIWYKLELQQSESLLQSVGTIVTCQVTEYEQYLLRYNN